MNKQLATDKPSLLKRLSLALCVNALCTLSVTAVPLALTHINIIDVKNKQVLKDKTLIIEDDKILRIQDSDVAISDKDTRILDLKDHYVSPGLIDVHVHHGTDPDGWDNPKATRQRLRNLLVGGVTSVRDMGGDARALAYLKRQAQLDQIASPDIYFSVIIGGPEFFSDPRTVASAQGEKPGQVNWMRAVTKESDLNALLLQAKGTGATGIKIYAKVPANLVIKLVKKAKEVGLKVWSHAYIGPALPMDAINAGVETISHAPDMAAQVVKQFYQWRRESKSITDTSVKQARNLTNITPLINAMKTHGTLLDSTLTVFDQHNRGGQLGTMLDELGVKYTKLAYEAGVPIATGTDAFSDDEVMLYHEMKMLEKQVGMTPMDVMQAATLHGAKVIGIEQTHGSIEAGKTANMVIFSQNPADSLQHLDSISHVMKNGELIFRGNNPTLPFSTVRKTANLLWMSGQIGNFPGTQVLAGQTIEAQMHQAMQNIHQVLMSQQLEFSDIAKCTLMLADINDWQKASEVYQSYFSPPLPARSAFAAAGLALGAKVEIECVAQL